MQIGELKGKDLDKVTWDFTEEWSLLGLYGEVSPNGIEKLGMISLGTECQAQLDANPEQATFEDKDGELVTIDFRPVEEATTIPSPPENSSQGNTDEEDYNVPMSSGINEADLLPVKTSEETGSLSTFTWLIIVFGAVGFLVLITLTVLALKRGLGAKGDTAT